MYSPHKKCYEGYEILMDPVRWAVMGRFKRKEKNWRLGSNPASLNVFRRAKISKNKRGVPGGEAGHCHRQGPWDLSRARKLGSCKEATGTTGSKRNKSPNHIQTQTEPS